MALNESLGEAELATGGEANPRFVVTSVAPDATRNQPDPAITTTTGLGFPGSSVQFGALAKSESAEVNQMPGTVANLVSLLFLGFLLGIRHATDADHIVAIATIVSRQRNLRGSAMIGAVWGIGHTVTILIVGGAIILFGVVIPPRLGLAMEFSVGIMLIVLGVFTLTGLRGVIREAASLIQPSWRGSRDPRGHAHTHDGVDRYRPGEDKTPLARLDRRFGGLVIYQWLRPLMIGIVHGLAGSAAVALLVLTLVRDPLWAFTYLLLFGAGTICGMMVITLGLSAPFALTSSSLPRLNFPLRAAAGLISFTFGLFLIYEIGFAEGGLFTSVPSWQPQ